jgi:hypothetical protein
MRFYEIIKEDIVITNTSTRGYPSFEVADTKNPKNTRSFSSEKAAIEYKQNLERSAVDRIKSATGPLSDLEKGYAQGRQAFKNMFSAREKVFTIDSFVKVINKLSVGVVNDSDIRALTSLYKQISMSNNERGKINIDNQTFRNELLKEISQTIESKKLSQQSLNILKKFANSVGSTS